MKKPEWMLLAAGLLFFDVVFFIIPFLAVMAAYVIVFRPPWFKEWVEELYRGE